MDGLWIQKLYKLVPLEYQICYKLDGIHASLDIATLAGFASSLDLIWNSDQQIQN